MGQIPAGDRVEFQRSELLSNELLRAARRFANDPRPTRFGGIRARFRFERHPVAAVGILLTDSLRLDGLLVCFPECKFDSRRDGNEKRLTPTRGRRRQRRKLLRRRLRERIRRRNARRLERRRKRIIRRPDRRNDARRRALDRPGNRAFRLFEHDTKRRLDLKYFIVSQRWHRVVDNLRVVPRERLRRFTDRQPPRQT